MPKATDFALQEAVVNQEEYQTAMARVKVAEADKAALAAKIIAAMAALPQCGKSTFRPTLRDSVDWSRGLFLSLKSVFFRL